MFVIKVVALVVLGLSIWLAPGFNPTSSRSTSLPTVAFWVGLAALILFGGGALAPRWLDKVLTVVTVCVALVAPLAMVGMLLTTLSEGSKRQRDTERLVLEMTALGGEKTLASFFLRPDQVAPGLMLDLSQLERIERHLLTLPPQKLRDQHLVESFLLGVFVDASPAMSSTFPGPVLDALYRLYPKLKERSGFSPADAPFYLQQRDRLVSRLAEVGREKWLEEIRQEHPAFAEVAGTVSFREEDLRTLFPTPLAPHERVVSRSLGSLPLHVLMELNLRYFPAPPGLELPPDPIREEFRQRALRETRKAVGLMKSRGVDFTEEELKAPGLKAFLETTR